MSIHSTQDFDLDAVSAVDGETHVAAVEFRISAPHGSFGTLSPVDTDNLDGGDSLESAANVRASGIAKKGLAQAVAGAELEVGRKTVPFASAVETNPRRLLLCEVATGHFVEFEGPDG